MGGYYNPQSGGGLKILDEGVELSGLASSLDFTGAGVSATVVGSAVTANIGGVAGLSEEAPASGTCDGTNTVFTFVHLPKIIKLGGSIQSVIISGNGDYTLTGSSTPYTVTFVFPPIKDAILRNYY